MGVQQDNALIAKAKEFAIENHWGQMYGTKPYSHHLSQVAHLCKAFSLPAYVEAAAWLHDVVEDTDVHADQVSAEFGYEVATLVFSVTDADSDLDFNFLIKKDGLTERQAKDAIRKDKKAKTYPKILSHPYGVHLKLCDRIANVSASATAKDTRQFDKYCAEAECFEESLKTPGIAEEMWAELDRCYGKHKKQRK